MPSVRIIPPKKLQPSKFLVDLFEDSTIGLLAVGLFFSVVVLLEIVMVKPGFEANFSVVNAERI